MTLEEKAAQMTCVWQRKAETLVDANGSFDLRKAKAAFKNGRGLGQVGRPSDAGKGQDARGMAELTNAIQRFFIENTRLGIPVMFHEECLHGHAAIDATSFPQPIALGATFNPDLAESLFTMTAWEARLRGTHQALTPVVDVARDPRWGRVEETYGEDPYLVSRMGIAAVRGFQGDATFRDKKRVIATLKHFAAHGQPESGINCAPANVSMRVLRETFLYTFKEAIQKGGAISVMASYNEIDGVPSHANRWLLRDVLRKEWGFQGFVVSDYYAIWELSRRAEVRGHSVAKDKKEACALAVQAGVNIELPEPECYLHLVELVRQGVLKESQLDELVAPMLFWKFQMGLFDDPYVDPDEAERVVGCDDHRKLALQAAREAITLLKNEDHLAPLDLDRIQSIAVIGPNANRILLGGYSSVPKHNVTVLEGIQARAGGRVKVLYSEGCKITIGGSWHQDEVVPSDPDEDRRQIAEAVEVARQADVIVLAIGGNEQTSREAYAFNHLGDRAEPRPGRKTGRTGQGDDRDRQAGHCFPVQRPADLHQLHQPERAGDFRVLVSGPGDRSCGGGGLIRRFQSGREAADHHSSLRGPFARILQLQALGAPRLFVRRRVAALCVRLRLELHDFRHRERAAGQEENQPRRRDPRPGGRDQHRQARRERKSCRCIFAICSVPSHGRSRS